MNIGEIAKLASVSQSAVSRYFNNGYISEEKKEKIRKVVEKTGYVPSIQAKTLRTKKTKLIGVILPKISSESIGKIVSGLHFSLEKKGYQLLIADTENQVEKELDYIQIFEKQGRVDGIILITTMFTPRHKKLLSSLKTPVVLIGQRLEGFSCVYHDDFQAAYRLTKHMIEKGSKKIGYIGVSSKDISTGEKRLEGFLAALKENGLEFPKEYREITKSYMEAGYDSMKLLLKKSNLDGIFCATDALGVGALKALREAARMVPEEVQLVGVGDSELSQATNPTITTAHLSYKRSGIIGADLLMNMIIKEDVGPFDMKLDVQLHLQESTR